MKIYKKIETKNYLAYFEIYRVGVVLKEENRDTTRYNLSIGFYKKGEFLR